MKTKLEILQILGLSGEEKTLVAKALEKGQISVDKDILTSTRFLTLQEQKSVQKATSYAQIPFTFWGGSDNAERKISLFFASYQNENVAKLVSPISVLRATTKTGGLAHRDYLGALMALKIKRELVGDIYVREDGADIVICNELKDFLLDSFLEVGKAKIKVEILPISQLIVTEIDPEQILSTVPSLRLDALVSAGFRMSRSLASEFINAGRVIVNGNICTKPDQEVAEKDVFSIRGKGRVIFEKLGGESKKGRLHVELKKY